MDELRRIDLTVPPSKRFGFAHGDEIQEQLQVGLRDMFPLVADVRSALIAVSRDFFTNSSNEAGTVVCNHAFNDFDSFLVALMTGEGRNAARACRALYEHLINYCSVLSSVDSSNRYIQNGSVTASLIGKARSNLQLLRGRERQKEEHRLRNLERKSTQPLAYALKSYGKSFTRTWSDKDLRQRAANFNYETEYDTYRILSQVIHGSFGGVLGTYGSVHKKNVHRIGPSLDLSVFCYPEGMRFFRNLLREIKQRDDIETSRLSDSLNMLLHYWPEYRRFMLSIDKLLWPEEPPPPAVSILAFYGSGGHRWYYWEPLLKLMKPAEEPQDSDLIVRKFRAKMQDGSFGSVPSALGDRPFTVAVAHVTVTPKKDAKWFNDDALLTNRDLRKISWLPK